MLISFLIRKKGKKKEKKNAKYEKKYCTICMHVTKLIYNGTHRGTHSVYTYHSNDYQFIGWVYINASKTHFPYIMSVNKNNRYISFKIGLLRLHELHLHAKYHETSTLKSARDYWGKLLLFISKTLFCFATSLYFTYAFVMKS